MEKVKNEYGKKIGGSRRDQWCAAGLSISDLADMNEAEKKAYVIKDNVWPKPDYRALKDEGRDIEAVYFIKTVRDSLAVRPQKYEPSDEDVNLYIEGIGKVRDLVMKVTSKNEIADFKDKILKDEYFVPATERRSTYFIKPNPVVYLIGGSPFFKAVQTTSTKMASALAKKRFLYSDDDKALADLKPAYYLITGTPDNIREAGPYRSDDDNDCMLGNGYGRTLVKGLSAEAARAIPTGKWVLSLSYTYAGTFNTKEEAQEAALTIAKAMAAKTKTAPKKAGKQTFCYQTLESLRQDGSETPETATDGDGLISEFGFWGGEFGNWLNNEERQKNLDMSRISFTNIAAALCIDSEAVSFGGKLSIAFGARGKGNALAHYEPLRKVINLTKLRGAGSLAHEYGHALDFIKGEELGAGGSLMELADKGRSYKLKTLCPEAYDVYHAMMYKPEGGHTDYRCESMKMGRYYNKQGGYWDCAVEMFARAFACWMKDRLEDFGITDDYLAGHADLAVGTDDEGNVIRAYPIGEERTRINEAIDNLVVTLLHSGNPISEADDHAEESSEQTVSEFVASR